jgi:hypothetical protein
MKEIRYTKNDLLEIEKEVNNLIELINSNLDKFTLYNYKVYDFFNELYKHSQKINKDYNLDNVYSFLESNWDIWEQDKKYENLLENCKEYQYNRTSSRYLTNYIITDYTHDVNLKNKKHYNYDTTLNSFTGFLYEIGIINICCISDFWENLKKSNKSQLCLYIQEYVYSINDFIKDIKEVIEYIQDFIKARENIENYKSLCNLENYLEYLELNEMEF